MKRILLSLLTIFIVLFSLYFIASCNNIEQNSLCELKTQKQIHINFHDVYGENLIIDYNIKSAGVTKLRIFDKEEQLIWRNQYVNDHVGNYQIILKYNNMKSGKYRFEIEHKGQNESFFINKPY